MTQNPLIAKAEMLIRRPVAEVFEAFTNPDVTRNFWFTRGTAKLEAGAQIQWHWAMYGASVEVKVKNLEPNKRLLIEWDDPATTVEWIFTERTPDQTFVEITNTGFSGTPDEQVKSALDSTGGFNIVLCGAKMWLEHGIHPNFIADHAPDAVISQST